MMTIVAALSFLHRLRHLPQLAARLGGDSRPFALHVQVRRQSVRMEVAEPKARDVALRRFLAVAAWQSLCVGSAAWSTGADCYSIRFFQVVSFPL